MTAFGLAVALAMLIPATGAAAQGSSDPERVDMDLGDYQFHPSVVSIAIGDSVELVLTNRDSFIPHNFVIEAPEAGMEARVDVPNEESVSIVLTPTRRGSYAFYCDEQFLFFESHREKGMEGLIEVAGGG